MTGGTKRVSSCLAWKPPSVMVCALFSGSAKLTPKVQVMLNFLAEYLGTDRDPRLRGAKAKGYFTDVKLPPYEALD